MADLTLRHEMNCDTDTYFEKCVLDAEYNRRLFYEELKFKSYELVEQKDVGDTVVRKVKAEPQTANLPAPIKKVIGDSFGYVEEGTYDRKNKVYSFRTIPGGFPDKVKIHGTMRCEPLGDKRVTRITEIHVDVKIFMIGGMVEDRIVADVKQSYAKAAEFTNVWAKEKGYS
jgi:Protein of unknown function (DUF2505)